MTETSNPEQRPTLLHYAERVHGALEFDQLFGRIPERAVLRVCAVSDVRLAVVVSGLGDDYLLGPAAPEPQEPVLPREQMTLDARRVLGTAEHAICMIMPHVQQGRPDYEVLVWLQTDAQTAQTDQANVPTGVFSIHGGRIVT